MLQGGRLSVSLSKLAPKTEASFKTQTGNIQLIIEDTGCGISKQNQEKIFDPFFSTKEVGKGSGIGLSVVHSIVHSIVQRHDRVISIDSEELKGCSVKIRFPLTAQQEHDSTPVLAEIADVKEGKGHILLVEDEQALANVYQGFLESSGYGVTTRPNGSLALDTFNANPGQYDLVLTDQNMPIMTGKQLSQELLKLSPNTPIIMATGFSSTISEEEAYALGIRKYLMKPIKLSTLRLTISECLAQ